MQGGPGPGPASGPVLGVSSSIGQPRHTLARIRTDGYAAYSLAYSPFFPQLLAVASSANFGLVGNGRLHIAKVGAKPGPALSTPAGAAADKRFDTQDGLFDVAWSEVHENQLATASGDGSVKLWDIVLNDFPIRSWHEHTREIFCIDWGNIHKELFVTSSWDHTIKIWTPERPNSLQTINAHNGCVYASLFSPHTPDSLASCSADGLLKIWDLKATAGSNSTALPTGVQPAPAQQAALTIAAHPTEILSLDWNKYQPTILATASVDRTVRIHDIRMASNNPNPLASADGGRSCVTTLLGHDYAIRRVAWSPHSGDILASAGYDMTTRTWKLDNVNLPPGAAPLPPGAGVGRCTDIYTEHREFVVGLAWSLYEPSILATASWDQSCHVYTPNVI